MNEIVALSFAQDFYMGHYLVCAAVISYVYISCM